MIFGFWKNLKKKGGQMETIRDGTKVRAMIKSDLDEMFRVFMINGPKDQRVVNEYLDFHEDVHSILSSLAKAETEVTDGSGSMGIV